MNLMQFPALGTVPGTWCNYEDMEYPGHLNYSDNINAAGE